MRGVKPWISLGAILLSFVWAGSALGNGAGPKKIIMMIGDGMGPEQVQAGRLLADGGLVVDVMDPVPGFAITENYYGEITDSAASATALATGEKTYNGAVSVDVDGNDLYTAMEAAQGNGMATGILSSVYLCDATPGVWLAHAPKRSCSIIIPQQVAACPDVFLGPGETIAYKTRGKSKKGADYVAAMAENCNHEVVENADELAAAQAPNDRLLGVWGGYTLMYTIDRQNDPGINVPTLAEMTAKAIEVLNRDEDGFFLMVEGGAIDWMAHNKDIAGTARDVVAFDDAIAVAYDFAMDDGETLLIVTADHETGGLDLGNSPNVPFIKSITASTDYMYGLVLRGEMSAEAVLAEYAGVTNLTPAEKQAIADYGEMGISDALSVRANVKWWLPDGSLSVAPDEGDHTFTHVPVFAYGPGSDSIADGTFQNTVIGKLLLDLASGN